MIKDKIYINNEGIVIVEHLNNFNINTATDDDIVDAIENNILIEVSKDRADNIFKSNECDCIEFYDRYYIINK